MGTKRIWQKNLLLFKGFQAGKDVIEEMRQEFYLMSTVMPHCLVNDFIESLMEEDVMLVGYFPFFREKNIEPGKF